MAILLTIFWHYGRNPITLTVEKASPSETIVKNDADALRLKAELEQVKNNADKSGQRKDNQNKVLQARLQEIKQTISKQNQQIARLKTNEGRLSNLTLGEGQAPSAPRTADGTEEAIWLISPVNTKVRTDKPILRWASLSQAKDFRVSWFLVKDNRPVIQSVKKALVQGNEYQLPLLNRGQAYGWEVETAPRDSTMDSSSFKSRTAYFTVLDTKTWKKVKIRDEQYSRDAEAFLNAGLLENARHLIELLDVGDPARAKLLDRLKTLE